MKLYHFSEGKGFDETINDICHGYDIGYTHYSIQHWATHLYEINKCDVVLIEFKNEKELAENIIYEVKTHIKGINSTIILTDTMDFFTKKHFYNLGVSAIVNQNEHKTDQIKEYIYASVKEHEIFNTLQKMKIAVIDDSRFSLEIIKDFFTRCDVNHAHYFQRPEEVLKNTSQYDLFIVDLVMPVYSGEEMIHLIRKEKKDAIIIMITTYGDGTSIPHGMHIGADDFIFKPLNFKLFYLRISACVHRHKLRLENVQNEAKLFEMATRDGLTGIYNRTYFIDYYKKLLKQVDRSKEPFSMILLDIDHFKNINDEYGHLVGDRVLIALTNMLEKHLRAGDIICRWGGEEFIILLNDTTLEQSSQIAEKLRRIITELDIEGVKRITASFGVTEWLEEDDETSMFKRVDNSLYLAKLTGRNKVVSNEELYIYKGGLPVTIEWGPFFRSGHTIVDKEHSDLIVLSNELIQNCFIDQNEKKIAILFNRLINHIVDHFESEEDILREFDYESLLDHQAIHESLVEKTLQFKKQFESNEITSIALAKYMIQEVVVGHIIKKDFEFFEIFQNIQ